MIVGIPVERLREEYRVGMVPGQVASLVNEGHEVRVEAGAGLASGCPDEGYLDAGARIGTAAEAWDAELVVKVKAPLLTEYAYLRPGQTVFTYLHFDGNAPREEIETFVASGATGIAYEWVEEDGRFPLLEPMSRLSGVLFARRALTLLLKKRGDLGGDYGLEGGAARAMVFGLGDIGTNAAQTLARNDVRLVLIDKHPETLDERLRRVWGGWSSQCVERVIAFDEANPDPCVAAAREALKETDIIIGAAVRRPSLPRSRCRYLVDRASLSRMQAGSVLCDATANIRDFFETAVPTEGLYETYEECGVVHYNCDHIPSLAARTATRLLTAVTFPHVQALASGGFVLAASRSEALSKGTMCHAGHLTHRLTAANKGMPCVVLDELL